MCGMSNAVCHGKSYTDCTYVNGQSFGYRMYIRGPLLLTIPCGLMSMARYPASLTLPVVFERDCVRLASIPTVSGEMSWAAPKSVWNA
jgi:hypothetical protein